MRIAIVVPGRFHAFQLAAALIRRKHDVTLFTNYPRWFVERFDPSFKEVRTCLLHGVLSRIGNLPPSTVVREYCSSRLSVVFSRWAARQVTGDWDCVHCYSGASEELLHTLRRSGTPSLLFRGSAHIRTQARLLQEEAERTGCQIDRPDEWMVQREEREYQLATKVLTLSSFAQQTFSMEGFPREKVVVLPLGVDAGQFRASAGVAEERSRRILSGAPIRILFVGTLSMQKGCWDLVQMMERLPADRFEWRLIGQVTPEVRGLLPTICRYAEVLPHQSHQTLARWYADADIFLFPTIHDGFAAVLIEAQANALPLFTTTNCAGPDLVSDGHNGWVLPIRSPEAFVERLRWADEHREELAAMVRYLNQAELRTWDNVAADFEPIAASLRANHYVSN